jgi:hypothetical protein
MELEWIEPFQQANNLEEDTALRYNSKSDLDKQPPVFCSGAVSPEIQFTA